MTVRLVILGLLRERPLYGYEIKQIIEEHMSDWTSIAFGSIYFALDKLAEEKFVEKVHVEQSGKRPSRSVFQITDSGREEFYRLLRESWQTFEREYYPLDICLFFLDSLPLAEVAAYLKQRKAALQAALDYVQDHRAEQLALPEVPALAAAIFDHTLLHTQAELEWVTKLLQTLESGKGR
ncbi:MAG TPA: PadR family transcriptional regulator [Anaerolineaceae bacterium]|nr:PadR family transcriptional regulator [Anaerolineaceae bacterium]